MPRWWNGRHEGLKILCIMRAGSNPVRGTELKLHARVAELVDAGDLKSPGHLSVQVRLLSWVL